jgi:hypothetical protein
MGSCLFILVGQLLLPLAEQLLICICGTACGAYYVLAGLLLLRCIIFDIILVIIMS